MHHWDINTAAKNNIRIIIHNTVTKLAIWSIRKQKLYFNDRNIMLRSFGFINNNYINANAAAYFIFNEIFIEVDSVKFF